jgi:hypothetical protein
MKALLVLLGVLLLLAQPAVASTGGSGVLWRHHGRSVILLTGMCFVRPKNHLSLHTSLMQ